MVTVNDFISFLNKYNMFERFAKALKEHGAPSLRKMNSDEDRVERFFELATDLPFVSESEILVSAFDWDKTEEPGEIWRGLTLLWKGEILKKEETIKITREEIENYLESQGILEELKERQQENMEESIKEGLLPEDTTLDKIIETLFLIKKPQLYIEGTMNFAKTENPEKWIEINRKFRKWLATR